MKKVAAKKRVRTSQERFGGCPRYIPSDFRSCVNSCRRRGFSRFRCEDICDCKREAGSECLRTQTTTRGFQRCLRDRCEDCEDNFNNGNGTSIRRHKK